MSKIYGALEVAQLEWFTDAGKPAASSYIYRVIYVSDLKQVMVSDGTNWIPFLNTSTNQTINGNITFSGEQIFTGPHRLSVTTNTSAGAITAVPSTTPVIEFTGAVTSISGIDAPLSGEIIMLVNRTGGTFAVLDEDAGATASNRIRTGTGAQITVANNASLLLTYVGDNRWHVVGGSGSGSGSGVTNFITNGSAEADTLGWAVYADAAGASPVDGSGGSANVTFTRSTSSPLIGTASFLFAKDAANRQGQGASYDFTIDSAYKAKVLQIDFEYLVSSGTFVAGTSTTDSDVTVWIYDVTNAVVIQPSSYRLLSNNASLSTRHSATFQSSSNSTSYRLIFHVATTSASAYTLKVDGISVSPEQYVYGTPVTDWQSFTPTGSWTTNTTYSGQWRRVGDSAEYQYILTLSGAPTAANLTLNLFSGHVIDTNKLSSTTRKLPSASGSVGDASPVNNYPTGAFYNNSTSVLITVDNAASTYGVLNVVTNIVPITFASGDTVTVTFSVPISGWSSSVQTSDTTDTRVVAARYFRSTALSSTTSLTTINFDSRTFDSHSAVTTGASWNYQIPVSGYYRIRSQVNMAPSGNFNSNLIVRRDSGGSITNYATGVLSYNNGTSSLVVDTICLCNSGDLIDVQLNNGSGTFAMTVGSAQTYFEINRLSGPSAIAASELITAQAATSAAPVLSNGNTVVFGTENFDSHGAYDASTGIFTAPISGTYEVGVFLRSANFTPSAGNFYGVNICKNGTTATYQVGGITANAAVSQTILIGGISQIKLNAGDTARITVSLSAGTLTLLNDAVSNVLNIKRIGN